MCWHYKITLIELSRLDHDCGGRKSWHMHAHTRHWTSQWNFVYFKLPSMNGDKSDCSPIQAEMCHCHAAVIIDCHFHVILARENCIFIFISKSVFRFTPLFQNSLDYTHLMRMYVINEIKHFTTLRMSIKHLKYSKYVRFITHKINCVGLDVNKMKNDYWIVWVISEHSTSSIKSVNKSTKYAPSSP